MLRAKDLELVLTVSAEAWTEIVQEAKKKNRENVRDADGHARLVTLLQWPSAEEMPLAFRERRECEEDATKRQVIPYTVVDVSLIKNKETVKQGVLVYQRGGGGEARLDAKYSIGIGGHINPCDTIASEADLTVTRGEQEGFFPCNLAAFVHEGRWREIYEELPEWLWEHVAYARHVIDIPVCWIDDRSDQVGSVHIGVVTQIELELDNDEAWESVCHEVQLDGGVGKVMSWSEAELLKDRMETWSRRLFELGLDLIKPSID